MEKQTAVNWLFEKMAQTPITNWYEITQEANEIFKDQISAAWDAGNHQYFCSKITNIYFENGLEFYKENYTNGII